MINIFSEDEKHKGYTESYVVNFTCQKPDGFWHSLTKRYFAYSKGRHKQVEAKFRKDHKDMNFKITSIVYE